MSRSCPECTQGKHVNCTEMVLDDNDELVPCGCICRPEVTYFTRRPDGK